MRNYLLNLLIGVGIFTFVMAADAQTDTIRVQNFVNQQNQIAAQQDRTLQEKQKKEQEETQKQLLQSEKDTAQNTSSVAEAKDIPPPVDTDQGASTEKLPLCNCNDQNSKYNYPSNFVYDDQHQKVYQIYPHCQCDSMTGQNTSITAPITVTPSATTTTATTGGNGETTKNAPPTNWNIQY